MNHFSVYVPFDASSVDIAKRMVWGTATVEKDLPDFQNDIVDWTGSCRAFNSWPRNVREMHTEKAVGRAIMVIPNHDNRTMRVGVRISDGAEDTWKKVLDGTLNAFSIGGKRLRQVREWNPVAKKYVNRILDYRLDELSLVDSPADPHCKVDVITKRNGQLVASDILSDVTQGAPQMDKNETISAIKKFAEGLTEGDEMVLIRKSDITEGEAEGEDPKPILVKADAPITRIKKDDADSLPDDYGGDADGGGQDDDQTDDGGAVDLEALAQNALEIHDVLLQLAGVGGGSDEQDPRDGQEPPAFKGRGMDKKDIEAITKAVESATATNAQIVEMFAKRLDGIENALGAGNGAAVRKGGSAAPDAQAAGIRDLFKTSDAPNGEGSALPGDGSDLAKAETLAKDVVELTAESRKLVKMRDSGQTLSKEDSLRLVSIGDELLRAKAAYERYTGKSSDVLTAQIPR